PAVAAGRRRAMSTRPVSSPGAAGGRPARASDIPSLERLLDSEAGRALAAEVGRGRLTGLLRQVLDEARAQVLAGALAGDALADAALLGQARARLAAQDQPRLRAVYNLTGTVLHTNLGRA